MPANITKLNTGQYAGFTVAEITSVPYYELLDKDLEKANLANQAFFTQIINGLHRRGEPGFCSYELLFTSAEVHNQTYKAQVRIFFIARMIESSEEAVKGALSNIAQGFRNDFNANGYSLRFLETDGDLTNLLDYLEQVDTSSVLNISKRERATESALSPSGYVYFTDVAQPAANRSMSPAANALSQYPRCAVSLQIIPTAYTAGELLAIEETKKFLDFYAGNMLYRQGMRPDASTQQVMGAYKSYSECEKEPLFYYNFTLYSQKENAYDLANKIIDALESDDKTTGSSFETIDITGRQAGPCKGLAISPWATSDLLVHRLREENAFWRQKNAPTHLMRLKYLMTTKEIRPIFKAPIDDGRVIGIPSRKIEANRDKLHNSVIAHDNFKVGVIMNASKAGLESDTHAGIDLNQFTKHGLIVGMPGSGKTNFSLGLLLQFWKDFGIPFLAIEPTKTEYRSLIDEIPELQVFTPGKNNISPFIINPFAPPRDVTVESYAPSLAAAFKASFSMPDPLPDIFLGAVNDCYNEHGWKSSSTSADPDAQPFGLHEFIRTFKRRMQHLDYKGDVKSNLESAGVVRLTSLINQNSNIYDTVNTIPIEDLLSKPTVIELNAINNKEQKSLIMALLLILFCSYTKNNISGDSRLKNVLLIDEAHVLLSKGRVQSDAADSRGSTVEALEDMIKEIRSYGTSIIIADQSPTAVGREIVANTDVKVIFRLVERDNRDILRTTTNMSDADYDELGRLGVGEALLHNGKLDRLLHIRTYNVAERANIRPVIPDREIAAAVKYWETHRGLLIPHMECKYNGLCSAGCDMAARTNADFIATRFINKHLHGFKDKNEFLRFLVTMDALIAEIAGGNSSIAVDGRLVNCAKIKFLRKTMIERDFGITAQEYDRILSHRNFLREGGGSHKL